MLDENDGWLLLCAWNIGFYFALVDVFFFDLAFFLHTIYNYISSLMMIRL